MSDQKVVAGGMSREEVTLKLVTMIANAENKTFNGSLPNTVSRAWILNTYSQCKLAVESGWGAKDIFSERPLGE